MGTDKALLPVAGRPLVEHAVLKLRRLCAEVKICGSDLALEEFAPVVRDLHPGCGPMAGIEAALRDSSFDWNLIVPVDVPFVTTAYLGGWLGAVLARADEGCRLAMIRVDETPQPTLLVIHREVCPYLTAALEGGRYKLRPVLMEAGAALAERLGKRQEAVFWQGQHDDPGIGAAARVGAKAFANLNTPEEFEEAERCVRDWGLEETFEG